MPPARVSSLTAGTVVGPRNRRRIAVAGGRVAVAREFSLAHRCRRLGCSGTRLSTKALMTGGRGVSRETSAISRRKVFHVNQVKPAGGTGPAASALHIRGRRDACFTWNGPAPPLVLGFRHIQDPAVNGRTASLRSMGSEALVARDLEALRVFTDRFISVTAAELARAFGDCALSSSPSAVAEPGGLDPARRMRCTVAAWRRVATTSAWPRERVHPPIDSRHRNPRSPRVDGAHNLGGLEPNDSTSARHDRM